MTCGCGNIKQIGTWVIQGTLRSTLANHIGDTEEFAKMATASADLGEALLAAEQEHREMVLSFCSKRDKTTPPKHPCASERSRLVSEYLRLPVRRHGYGFHRVGMADLLWL
jgi:hypothetical protein